VAGGDSVGTRNVGVMLSLLSTSIFTVIA